MLKREITYEDFNGDTVTEVFYFNISKPELIELEVEGNVGLGTMIQQIIDTKNHEELIKKFKRIILLAYGEKSPDGKHFLKSPEARALFEQSAAYSKLFVELATDDDAASVFIKGVLPKDIVTEMDKPVETVTPSTQTN